MLPALEPNPRGSRRGKTRGRLGWEKVEQLWVSSNGFIQGDFCPADPQRALGGCSEPKLISAVEAEWPKAESADPQPSTSTGKGGSTNSAPWDTTAGTGGTFLCAPTSQRALALLKSGKTSRNGIRRMQRLGDAKWGTGPYIGSKKSVDVSLRDMVMAVLGNGWIP